MIKLVPILNEIKVNKPLPPPRELVIFISFNNPVKTGIFRENLTGEDDEEWFYNFFFSDPSDGPLYTEALVNYYNEEEEYSDGERELLKKVYNYLTKYKITLVIYND